MNTFLLKGTCPYCGSATKVRPASEIYAGRMNSGAWGNVLSCVNYPMCDAYVGMHAGTMTPKGSLANRELRELRKRAHALFDAYAVDGEIVTRKQAYGIAAQWLGLNPFHIGEMRLGGCSHFIERVSELKDICSQVHKLAVGSLQNKATRRSQAVGSKSNGRKTMRNLFLRQGTEVVGVKRYSAGM